MESGQPDLAGAVTGVILLNVAPLVLPGVAAGEAVDAIAGATQRFGVFNNNVSLGFVIADSAGFVIYALGVVAILGLASWWVINKPGRPLTAGLLLLALATILIPISWAHYALTVIPLAIWVGIQAGTSSTTRALIVIGFMAMAPTGLPWLTTLGVCFFAAAAIVERLAPGSTGADPGTNKSPEPRFATD